MGNPALCGAVNDYYSASNNIQNSACGFPPMRFSDTFPLNPAVRHRSRVRIRDKKRGVLIIPFTSLNKPKPKPSTNRKWSKNDRAGKYVTYSEYLLHDGIKYPLNVTKKSGIFVKPMHKLIAQINTMISCYSRITIIRFDLRQKRYTSDNKPISRFIDALIKKAKRKFKTKRVGYVWAREVATNKKLHYHLILIFDGKVVERANRVLQVVNSLCRRNDSIMSIGYCQTSYFNVDDTPSKLEAVKAISYLCKQRTKGYRSSQAKDYSTSRLTPKIKT